MILTVLRALFVLLMAAIGWTFVLDTGEPLGRHTWLLLAIALVLAVLIVCVDILSPRRKLLVFSCVFTGLVVGVLAAWVMSFVVTLLVDYAVSYLNADSRGAAVSNMQRLAIIQFVTLLVGVVCCYFAISFVLQTGDDFRFIIPYVEFSRQTKGPRPILLDTNVLIDGRIAEVVETGVIESELFIPQFVVKELRVLADSGDRLKRNRGKHGQEILQKLTENARISCRIYESHGRDDMITDVDERLISLAKDLTARIMTTDVPLAQEAKVKGVDVININDLATRLKTQALPGERLVVEITKPGELPDQGVGYLSDGTMVVIEDGRRRLNDEVEITVTNVRQNPNGKMIFGKIGDGRAMPQPRREKSESKSAT